MNVVYTNHKEKNDSHEDEPQHDCQIRQDNTSDSLITDNSLASPYKRANTKL